MYCCECDHLVTEYARLTAEHADVYRKLMSAGWDTPGNLALKDTADLIRGDLNVSYLEFKRHHDQVHSKRLRASGPSAINTI